MHCKENKFKQARSKHKLGKNVSFPSNRMPHSEPKKNLSLNRAGAKRETVDSIGNNGWHAWLELIKENYSSYTHRYLNKINTCTQCVEMCY